MAELTLGCHEVHVISPPKPIFKVQRPASTLKIVVPVVGPPGPAGDIENLSWNDIPDKPLVFPPAPHTHPKADVTGLVTTLNDIESQVGSSNDMPDFTVIFENNIA